MRENDNEGFWPVILGIWLVEIFGVFVAYLGVSGEVGNAILSYYNADLPLYATTINVTIGVGGLAIMAVAGIGIVKVIRVRISD